MEWSTAYFLEGEHQIEKNALLTTLPTMTKEWKVTFDVNPTDYKYTGFGSVLHLTIGGSGLGSSAKEGDRIPAIWLHKTRGVLVSSALSGHVAVSRFFKNLPPAGTWTRIEISQTLVSSKYMFSITIGNKQVLSTENRKPLELSNVKAYAGSPWYAAQKGKIRNLVIEIKTPINYVQKGEATHDIFFNQPCRQNKTTSCCQVPGAENTPSQKSSRSEATSSWPPLPL